MSRECFPLRRGKYFLKCITNKCKFHSPPIFLLAVLLLACAASELNPGIVLLRNSARILVLDPQQSSTIYILDLDWPLRVSVVSDLVIGQSTVIIMQAEDK